MTSLAKMRGIPKAEKMPHGAKFILSIAAHEKLKRASLRTGHSMSVLLDNMIMEMAEPGERDESAQTAFSFDA